MKATESMSATAEKEPDHVTAQHPAPRTTVVITDSDIDAELDAIQIFLDPDEQEDEEEEEEGEVVESGDDEDDSTDAWADSEYDSQNESEDSHFTFVRTISKNYREGEKMVTYLRRCRRLYPEEVEEKKVEELSLIHI